MRATETQDLLKELAAAVPQTGSSFQSHIPRSPDGRGSGSTTSAAKQSADTSVRGKSTANHCPGDTKNDAIER